MTGLKNAVGRATAREVAMNPDTGPALPRRLAWPAVGILLGLVVYGANAATMSPASPGIGAPMPFTIPSGFSVPVDFPGAVKALESLTGAHAEQLTVTDSLGFPARTNGASVGVQAGEVDALLLAAQPLFLEHGFFLFRHESNYGIGGEADEVGLVPLRDQLDVVQLVGTNGANFDITTDSVVAWLRGLHSESPIILTGIGDDHIEGRFVRPVGADAEVLAERVHAFCPDVVDQGTGSVKELANEIARLNTFYCWWD